MGHWTPPPGGGYSGQGKPATPPGPPPKNPGSATPQGRTKEAFVLQEALDSMRGRAEAAEAQVQAVRALIAPQWRSIDYDRNALIDDIRAALDTGSGT